jgi:hypothetical protein
VPCFIVTVALFTPRVALVLVWLFSNFLHRAYDTALWPLLGFLFMPLTTLAYAFALNSAGSIRGIWFGFVLAAALMDLGVVGGSGRQARRRRRRRTH